MAPKLESLEVAGESQRTRTSKWIQKIAQEFWDNHDSQNNQRIPMAKVKESLLETEEADRMPNSLVINLLQKADLNNDGYIDYDEYMKFAESASRFPRRRDTFSRAALTVVPRNERTLEKRYYLQKYSCCPPPLFMILVTLFETGVFIYYIVDTKGNTAIPPIYSPLVYNPFRRYEVWRFMTYALVHSGYSHFIGNILVQLVLGIALELVHGWWRVGLIYLSGVLFGSLAQSISQPNIFVTGASGGVFAIEYAHIGNLLLNWSQMELRWIQLIIVLVLSLSNLSLAIWDSYISKTPSNTGHLGHLGGAIAGVTVGIYVLRNFEKKRWEKYCWWVALVVFLILIVVGIILNATLPVPGYFPYNDKAPIGQARADYFSSKWDWVFPPKNP